MNRDEFFAKLAGLDEDRIKKALWNLYRRGPAQLRERIESIGAKFRPLPAGADFDLRDIVSVVPELKNMPPGQEWLRVVIGRFLPLKTCAT